MIEWNVYLSNDECEYDTVFFTSSLDEHDVLESLINHDNYPSDITVQRVV